MSVQTHFFLFMEIQNCRDILQEKSKLENVLLRHLILISNQNVIVPNLNKLTNTILIHLL